MLVRCLLMALLLFVPGCGGCTQYRQDLDYSYNVQQTWSLEELGDHQIVQFESVFWEPDDTVSLRKLIVDEQIAVGRDVLEIGTGTGLLSILCLQNEASKVLATDINPAAVANAKYNAAMLCPDQDLVLRQVDSERPSAFAVIADSERFDLIISNPPWEDGVVAKPADYAFYDPGFELMKSILDGLPKHLKPTGRCLLAYGHVPAIKRLQIEAAKRNYEFKILDDRDLDTLDTDFLPGMLVEIRLPLAKRTGAAGNAGTKPADSEPAADTNSPTTDDESPDEDNGS